ncbi:MAG: hypothetical protein CMA63_08300 [Euryarchaeota archaeon]|nr:hypothetical protein [Euryarchaeota archaeon]|tara:strand:+ start:21109 stop:21792 length:684 start_codon:yes stop_codon:yes gene_type:complete
MMRVGIAMLQGARHEHTQALRTASEQLGIPVEVVELRSGKDVDETLDALVLPGGESTAMRKASESEALLAALFSWMTQHAGRPVLGTCAGAILLASPGRDYQPFIQASIARNAWGRQRESFEAMLQVSLETPSSHLDAVAQLPRDRFNHQPLPVSNASFNGEKNRFHGLFIRAPRFEQDTIQCTKVVELEQETVGVLDGSKLALTFHPELTNDYRFHRWLILQADSQ